MFAIPSDCSLRPCLLTTVVIIRACKSNGALLFEMLKTFLFPKSKRTHIFRVIGQFMVDPDLVSSNRPSG